MRPEYCIGIYNKKRAKNTPRICGRENRSKVISRGQKNRREYKAVEIDPRSICFLSYCKKSEKYPFFNTFIDYID